MHFVSVFAALGIFSTAIAAPTTTPITKRAWPAKLNSYIITFDSALSKDIFLQAVPNWTHSGSRINYDYDLIPAVAFTLVGEDLLYVRRHAGVRSIEQDSILSIDYEPGIDRTGGLEGRSTGPSGILHERESNGEGVDVYGIDTGIHVGHECFGGRARWGAVFGKYNQTDGNGHGTHTTGTAVGIGYGIATSATVIAVKVLADDGSGAASDIIAGVQYAHHESKRTNRPSIAIMSLVGMSASSTSLDDAVYAAIQGGLHFAIAAGNDNADARAYSPAHVDAANTIGAVDADNYYQKANFSNYGAGIDVWAPGVNIKGAWIGTYNAVNILSGTSMATPYVAGIMAVALGGYGQMSPAALSEELKKRASDEVTFSKEDELAGRSSTHKLARVW